jgi:hypothetical protein
MIRSCADAASALFDFAQPLRSLSAGVSRTKICVTPDREEEDIP